MYYKVFIVDDEELVIKSLKASVDWTGSGFEVIGYALSGEEALETIEHVHPDVIFTDVRMPGMNGLELIKRISEKGVSAKYMVISGHAEFALAQKAIQHGVFGYCLKPFDEMEIAGYLNRIKKELDASRQLSEDDILDLIESDKLEAKHRLQHLLDKAGIVRKDQERLILALTVRKDKLSINESKPCLTLRVGYRKFIYLMADTDMRDLRSALYSNDSYSLKGIGFSKPFSEAKDITHAIQDAELQAYQYFTLANCLEGEGNFKAHDMWPSIPKLETESDMTAKIAWLDSMLPMFQSGHCDIRHALLVYNDCVSKLRPWGRDVTDLYLYSFDQLTDLFGDVREMIDYLKGLIWCEQDGQSVHVPLARNQIFHTMLSYINENFSEDVSIQGLSKMFNVNANYISQLFRKELDTTFTEYLSGLRMKRAAALLKSTSVPINEIADQVGYKDYFYFSKLFKKTIGVPPKAYRNDRTPDESDSGS